MDIFVLGQVSPKKVAVAMDNPPGPHLVLGYGPGFTPPRNRRPLEPQLTLRQDLGSCDEKQGIDMDFHHEQS